MPRQSMAKLLHCGRMICPTSNAVGIASRMPRKKLSPICAPFSRLANRLQTTHVNTRPPGAEGQAVASQKPLITRNASALREPNSKASDQSRWAASPCATSFGALPTSTSSSAWVAAMA
ncbi:hypothetical protein D3C79_812270 [compost metagenome]